MCIKEGSVCWYDGLSCKLNSVWLSKVQFLFFLRNLASLRAKVSLCSSMVERNTLSMYLPAIKLKDLLKAQEKKNRFNLNRSISNEYYKNIKHMLNVTDRNLSYRYLLINWVCL